MKPLRPYLRMAVLALLLVLPCAPRLRAEGTQPKVLESRPMTAADREKLDSLFGAPTPQADPYEPVNKVFAECVAKATSGEELLFSAYREPTSAMFARLAVIASNPITNPTIGFVIGDVYTGKSTPISATNVLTYTSPQSALFSTAAFGSGSAKSLNVNWPGQAGKTFQATFDAHFTTSVNLGFEVLFNGEIVRCTPQRTFGMCEIDPDVNLAYFESAWETEQGLSLRTETVRDGTLTYRVCLSNGQPDPLPMWVQVGLPPGLEAAVATDPLFSGFQVTLASMETRVFTTTLVAKTVGNQVVRANFQRRQFLNQPIVYDPISVLVNCPVGQDCTPVVVQPPPDDYILFIALARH